jgi:hypothetical protein
MQPDKWFEQINPNQIFRECDAKGLFGYSTTVLKEKIKEGSIPAPKLLAPPPSRATGWFGWQVIEHYRALEAKQDEWAVAAKKLYESRPPPPNRKKVKKVTHQQRKRAEKLAGQS